ncbi:MAG: 4Fe-4S binding protein [Chloroflexi bacterium]|nr:4Fe-4S binding protein [Chloroflexota bacterium]
MSFGLGLMRGLGITMRHFVGTYIGDFKHFGRAYDDKALAERQSVRTSGIFTVQYPEEKLEPPENFRFLPFLVYEPVVDEKTGKPVIDEKTGKEAIGYERCTACGICAKACPPQCIWIVRAQTPEGKPRPKAAEFYIDIDVCMNCGYCAEFCPFDAIKMDHDYELANYERHVSHIYDMTALLKSTTYYSKIRPTDWEHEEADRRIKEAAKAKKQASA